MVECEGARVLNAAAKTSGAPIQNGDAPQAERPSDGNVQDAECSERGRAAPDRRIISAHQADMSGDDRQPVPGGRGRGDGIGAVPGENECGGAEAVARVASRFEGARTA